MSSATSFWTPGLRRALSLHAPSSVRCPLRARAGCAIAAAARILGSRQRRGRSPRIARRARTGDAGRTAAQRRGAGATWTPVSVDLDKFGSRVIALELRAIEASRGGRVVFGEPVIARSEEREPRSSAHAHGRRGGRRGAGSTAGPTLGPGARAKRARAARARVGGVFRSIGFRARFRPRSWAPFSPACRLARTRWKIPSARLPEAARTLGKMIKEASGRSAMFTSVPTTFAAFGFDAGWDRYQTFSPVRDLPGARAVRSSLGMARSGAPGEPAMRFVLIHARGAHPPWDVSREEAARLRPTEYGGAIEPRRAGILLGALRTKRQKSQRRIGDDDWVRLRALEEAAMVKQNAGIAQLVNTLRQHGAWDDALLIFVGDVAPGDPPGLPYDTAGPSVKIVCSCRCSPSSREANSRGKEVASAVTTSDITFTVLEALRLRAPEGIRGFDLFAVAAGNEPPGGRPLVATLGSRYATRLGSWLLLGESGRQPTSAS